MARGGEFQRDGPVLEVGGDEDVLGDFAGHFDAEARAPFDGLVEQRTRLVGISFGECVGERGDAHGGRAGRADLAGEGQALGRQRDRGVDVATSGMEGGRPRETARRVPELAC